MSKAIRNCVSPELLNPEPRVIKTASLRNQINGKTACANNSSGGSLENKSKLNRFFADPTGFSFDGLSRSNRYWLDIGTKTGEMVLNFSGVMQRKIARKNGNSSDKN
jgi:hypothetical protein